MVSTMAEMMVEATTKEILLPGPWMDLQTGKMTAQLQAMGLWMGKMTDCAMGLEEDAV